MGVRAPADGRFAIKNSEEGSYREKGGGVPRESIER